MKKTLLFSLFAYLILSFSGCKKDEPVQADLTKNFIGTFTQKFKQEPDGKLLRTIDCDFIFAKKDETTMTSSITFNVDYRLPDNSAVNGPGTNFTTGIGANEIGTGEFKISNIKVENENTISFSEGVSSTYKTYNQKITSNYIITGKGTLSGNSLILDIVSDDSRNKYVQKFILVKQ